MDIEQQEKRHRVWVRLGALVAFAAYAYFLMRLFGPVIAIVGCAPVVGSAVAWWFVHQGAGGSLRWFRWLAWKDRQGRHHAFDDIPLRLRQGNFGPEVAARDVFAVLRLPRRHQARLLRRLALTYPGGLICDETDTWWFREPELLDWLDRHNKTLDSRQLRFRHWLARETFPALRRKAELAQQGGRLRGN